MTRRLPPPGSVFAWLADEGEWSAEEWVMGPLDDLQDVAEDLAEQAAIGEPDHPDNVMVHVLDPAGRETVWRVHASYEVTWHADPVPDKLIHDD